MAEAQTENRPGNNPMKAMTLIISILAVVGGMAAVIAPMQGRMDSMELSIQENDNRSANRKLEIDKILQSELGAVDDRIKVQLKDLEKLFEAKNEALRFRIFMLENEVLRLRKVSP